MKEQVRVRVGGLMRCCLETLTAETTAATEAPKEGDYLRCRYCSGRMRFRDSAWEWHPEREHYA